MADSLASNAMILGSSSLLGGTNADVVEWYTQ